MENNSCSQCGVEIESQGVSFRGRVFCGDECCEEFAADFAANGEPDSADLTDGLDDDSLDDDSLDDNELDDNELGYSDEDPLKEARSDDDYDIETDDF